MKLTWHSTWNSMGWLEYDPQSSRLTKDVTELSRAVAQLPGPPTGGGFLVLPTNIWWWKWRAWRRNKIYENTFQTWRDSFLFIWIEGEEVFLYFSFFCVWKSKFFKCQHEFMVDLLEPIFKTAHLLKLPHTDLIMHFGLASTIFEG